MLLFSFESLFVLFFSQRTSPPSLSMRERNRTSSRRQRTLALRFPFNSSPLHCTQLLCPLSSIASVCNPVPELLSSCVCLLFRVLSQAGPANNGLPLLPRRGLWQQDRGPQEGHLCLSQHRLAAAATLICRPSSFFSAPCAFLDLPFSPVFLLQALCTPCCS